MKTLVIIPTYNEKDNVVELIKNIFTFVRDIDVLIVDDNSPDGTCTCVEEAFGKDPKVHFIKKGRRTGLGTAYISGFQYGLKNSFDFIITMDADFSHDPKEIVKFIETGKEYDVVIGSRYISEGGLEKCRVDRIIISRLANFICKTLFGFKCSDYTSGFRGYRKEVIKKINSDIVSNSYSALEEILFQCHISGFSIGEIPIIFHNRIRGSSKLSFFEIICSAKEIFRFWWKIRRKDRVYKNSKHYNYEMDFSDFIEYVKYYPISLALRESARLKVIKNYELAEPILDVGCGDGFFMKMIGSQKVCWGIDINAKEIEKTRSRNIYDKAINEDIAIVGLPKNFFSTCIANCSIEHVEDVMGAFNNIASSLRAGGKFFLFLPPHDWGNDYLFVIILRKVKLDKIADNYIKFMNKIWGHKNLYPMKEWENLLTKSGLKVLMSKRIISTTNTYIFEIFMPFAFVGSVIKRHLGTLVLFPKIRGVIGGYFSWLVNLLYGIIDKREPTAEYLIVCEKD